MTTQADCDRARNSDVRDSDKEINIGGVSVHLPAVARSSAVSLCATIHLDGCRDTREVNRVLSRSIVEMLIV
jgi:hypothetical protein